MRGTVRRSTLVQYESVVNRHIAPALGRLKLKSLTPAHVRGLYREELDSGLSPRTVQYIHVTLHKALKQAVTTRSMRTYLAPLVSRAWRNRRSGSLVLKDWYLRLSPNPI